MLFVILISLISTGMYCQSGSDSLKSVILNEVQINAYSNKSTIVQKLPEVYQTYIFSGKKNEVIQLENANINLAEKTGRQLFSKIPGVFVYDMDGSGNQINIATRGLDPHRSWEFNVRQDGIMINSDIYGYPASHYSMPLEAISRVELVRGTASLQYGAQFGGMINYVNRLPDTTKVLGIQNISTVGSFGLLSGFTSIGGKSGKFTYYGYQANRHSKGYRANGDSDYNGQFLYLKYQPADNFSIRIEAGRSEYLYHIPGPLNDSMFAANPQASTRSRNYFSPEIWVPSVVFEWKVASSTLLEWTNSAVLGKRKSVQVEGTALTKDEVNPLTGQFNPRQVDIDGFNSYTSELRFKHNYSIASIKSVLAAGVRLIHNNLKRKQLGVGSMKSDPDFYAPDSSFKRNLNFKTENVAFYLENLLKLSGKWSISPGVRWENGNSKMSGYISYLESADIPNEIRHQFFLAGVSSKYQLNKQLEIYGGWSQAYRPVIFKDIIPSSILESTSKNLKDAYGYNAELGISGIIGTGLSFDMTLFSLGMKNRLGSIAETDQNGNLSILRTNIGNSKTNGLEMYVQYKLIQSNTTIFTIFTSTSYMNGVYKNASARDGNVNKSIDGNKIESVPDLISRNGLEFQYKNIGINFLHSFTGSSFSDPLNTSTPSREGTRGIVPSYNLFDAGVSYKASENFSIRLNVNNILDKSYFTKRPLFYPGTGVWPSDGRSMQLTVSARI